LQESLALSFTNLRQLFLKPASFFLSLSVLIDTRHDWFARVRLDTARLRHDVLRVHLELWPREAVVLQDLGELVVEVLVELLEHGPSG